MAEYKSPQYRSQLVERPTLDTSNIAGTGMANFAKGIGALGDAFGGMARMQQAKEQEQDKIELEQIEKDIQARLSADPKGAYQAYRTGDYSKYSDVEITSHAILGRSIPKYIGKLTALEAKQELREGIEKLDPLANGNDFVDSFIAEKAGENADPYFAGEFSDGIRKHAQTMLETRRKAINTAQRKRIIESIPLLVDEMIVDARDPADLETMLVPSIQALQAATGSASVEAREAIRDATEARIMEIANDPEHDYHGRAWAMAKTPDEHGVSMATRNPKAWIEAQKNAAANSNVLNGRLRRMYQEAEVELSGLIKSGAPSETVLDYFNTLQKAARASGSKLNSATYMKLKKSALDYVAKNAGNDAVFSAAKNGAVLPWSKVKKSMDSYQENSDNGDDKATAKLRLLQGVYGATDEAKANFSRGLATDPVSTLETTIGLAAANNRDISDYFQAKDGALARGLAMYAKTVDQETLRTTLPQIMADRNELGSNGTNPYLGRYNQTMGIGDRAQKEGEKGLKDLVFFVYDDLKSHYGNEIDNPASMTAKIRDAIGVATLITYREGGGVGAVDNAKIRDVATKIMKGVKLAPSTDKDGNIKMVIDQTATIQNKNGMVVPAPDLTAEVVKEAHSYVAEGVDGASIRADELTKRNGFLTVYRENAMGVETPIMFIPGTKQVLLKEEADRLMPYLPQEATDTEGYVRVEIPREEDAPNVDLGPATVATYKDNALVIQVDPTATRVMGKAEKDIDRIRRTHFHTAMSNAELRRKAMAGKDAAAAAEYRKRMKEPGFDPLDDTVPELSQEQINEAQDLFEKTGMTPEEMLEEAEKKRQEYLKEATGEVPGADLQYLEEDEGEDNAKHPALIRAEISLAREADRKTREAVMKALMDTKIIGPRANKAMENLPDYEDIPIDKLDDEAQYMTATLGEPEALGDPDDLVKFIAHVESGDAGFSKKAYKDSFKDPKTGKLNEAMSVGYGINLERPDIAQLLKDAGAPSKSDILKGAEITEPMARKMKEMVLEKTKIWLRKHFEGVALQPHQWIALMSLAYNSKWKDGGPSLIGKDITAAIKRGDMKAAHDEILYRSAGVDNPKYKEGILRRRRKEAALFAGIYDIDAIIEAGDNFSYNGPTS